MTPRHPCCPVYGTPTPRDRLSCEHSCCSIECYKRFWRADQTAADGDRRTEPTCAGTRLTDSNQP